MAFTVTSNYAGKAAGFYISAALNEAVSLENMTLLQNIKFKENIQRMAGSTLVKDGTCDFTDAGTLALTEKVLAPKELQINIDLCKQTLLTGWAAEEMKAGAWNRTAPTFDEYVISYFSQIIADGVEGSIWNGAAATAGEFEGFQTGTTGQFAVDGTVVASSASAAYSATNIIANLQTLVADIPTAVYGKENLRIYMNMKTYRFYISAISTLGYVNAYNMNDSYEPYFEGIKIAKAPGMSDNVMCAAETSNLYFGTDLLSDTTMIKMLDMSELDGSDNLRVVAKYTGGVQLGVGSDIVNQT
jgi:hypothetical protein